MASHFTIKLITQAQTHLWEDSLFFLEKAIEIKGSNDKWHLGTYSRGSVLCSTAAFEASCNHLFEEIDFSKGIPKTKKPGIIPSILHFMNKKFKVMLPDHDPYWDKLGNYVDYRNAFAHGKCDQSSMLLEHDDLLAAKTAVVLLMCLQHLYQLSNKNEEPWIAAWEADFKQLVKNDMPLIDSEINEFQALFNVLPVVRTD